VFVLLNILIGASLVATARPIHVSKPVAELVAPVLTSFMQVRVSEDEHTLEALDAALDHVFANQTRASWDGVVTAIRRGERCTRQP